MGRWSRRGGTYVWINGSNEPLIVAGGGAGGGDDLIDSTIHNNAYCGQVKLDGHPNEPPIGVSSCNNYQSAPSSGYGGKSGGSTWDGGGGGGWYGNGVTQISGSRYYGRGGNGVNSGTIQSGIGIGADMYSSSRPAKGGFGGGGGTGYDGGGGGGGYTGGIGGVYGESHASGGGSYIHSSGTNSTRTKGGNTADHGKVVLRILDPTLIDSDGDGFVDAVESQYGTNLSNSSSYPNIPSILKSASLWMDASNIDGAINTGLGIKIGEWKDLSGNGNHVYQSSDADKPQRLVSEQLNSKDTVLFEASSSGTNPDYLFSSTPVVTYPSDSSKGITLIALAKRNADGGSTILSFDSLGSDTTYAPNFYLSNNAISLESNNNGSTSINYDYMNSGYYIVVYRIKNLGNSADIFLNGEKIHTGSIGNFSAGSNLIIGRRGYSPSPNGLSMNLAELLMFADDLSDAQITELIEYLRDKWDLSSVTDLDGDGFVDAVEQKYNTDLSNSSSVPSIPSVLKNSILWLDATNINGLGNTGLNSDASISEWKDLSGKGNHAIQTNSSYYPKYKSESTLINEKEAVEFNLSNSSYLTVAQDFHQSTQDMHYFMVLKTEYTSNQAIFCRHTTSKSNQFLTGYWTSKWHFSTNNGANISFNPNVTPINQTFILEFSIDSSTDTMIIKNNDILEGSLTKSGLGTPAELGSDWLIGQEWDPGFSDPFKGHISEFIVMDQVLSAADRSAIYDYLNNKWGEDPTSKDTDGDGFTDAVENHYETDITNAGSMPNIPNILTDAAIWLDAENINGKSNTGLSQSQAVSIWKDLSGNGQHAKSIGSSNSPLYKNNIDRLSKALQFDGGNDGMTLGTLDITSDFSIFIVNRYYGSTQGRILQSSKSGNNWLLGRWYGNLSMYVSNAFVSNGPKSGLRWTIDNGNKTGSTNSYYTNGKFKSTLINSGSPRTLGLIGSNYNGSDGFEQSQAQIAEIIVFDKYLTDLERAKVTAYLAKKWNLTTAVDSDNDGYVDAVEKHFSTDWELLSSKPVTEVPQVINDSILWIDAENIDGKSNTSLNSGDAVDLWYDLSGTDYNLKKGEQGSPDYEEVDNYSGVKFNGSDDYLTNLTNINILSDATIYLVIDKDSYGWGYKKLFYTGDQDKWPTGYPWGILISESDRPNIFYSYGSYASGQTAAEATLSGGKKIIKVTKTSSHIKLQVDNGLVTQGNSVGNVAYTSVLRIGYGYRTEFWDGVYNELIVFNRQLTQSESDNVYDYLFGKWKRNKGGGLFLGTGL